MIKISRQAIWARRNKEKVKASGKRYREEMKEKCLKYYSKGLVPNCICCGETEPLFLCLDHIDGGGSKHRKEINNGNKRSAGGYSTYKWAEKNNFPPIFQVLCLNCNGGKELNGGVCPHKKRTVSI